MKHEINADRSRLVIKVTPEEQQELRDIRKCGGDCQCDVSMHDFLEPLTCNSALGWIDPADTGDLTDAPMLGVLGEEGDRHYHALRKHLGLIQTGQSENGPRFTSILERWAFMDYQVRSVLEDLRDKGECVFIG